MAQVKLKGEQALLNYLDASKAVREGKFEEARAIELLPSDRKLIEQKIEAQSASLANRGA